MPFFVEADVERAVGRFDRMISQIAGLPQQMGDQLTAWQKDDMRRAQPVTEMPDDHTVETPIQERGPQRGKHKPTGRPRGRPRGSRTVHHGKQIALARPRPRGSTRPILRPELEEKLVARMDGLLEAISWA